MASYRAPRIIGWITRVLFSLFIFSICGILIWRVFISAKIPKSIDTLAPNAKLTEAYEATDGNLTLRYQELSTISRSTDRYGYFSVPSYVFIQEAEQVQVVFRYNNSTILHLQEDYNLEKTPEKSSHLFDVSLVIATDLTPNDHTDDLDQSTLATKRIIPSCEPIREETALYTFYRYVFDGVSIEDITNSIYLDVYYVEDIQYDSKPYDTLLLYAWDEKWVPYSPSRADRVAMKNGN